jgi:hypothetical protein
MHPYYRNADKNQLLKETRGICFDDVIEYISGECLLDDKPHHNTQHYPHQRLLVIDIE